MLNSNGRHRKPKTRNVGPWFALFAAGSQLFAALEGSASAKRLARQVRS